MALHTLISAQAAAALETLPSVLEDFLAFRAENTELSDADSISKYLQQESKKVRKPSFRRRKGQRASGNRPKQPPSPWLNFLKATRDETREVLLNFNENEEAIKDLFFASETESPDDPDKFMQENYDKLMSKLPAADNPDPKLDVACISIYAGRRWKHMTDEDKAQYKSPETPADEAPVAPEEETPAVAEEPAQKKTSKKRAAGGRRGRKASA